MDQFSRTQLLLGKEGMDKLKAARVAVFGVGGVGGYAVEALARCGIGTLDIFDDDLVCMTNINRQIIATFATIGHAKVDVCEERIKSISPATRVNKYKKFYLPKSKVDKLSVTIESCTPGNAEQTNRLEESRKSNNDISEDITLDIDNSDSANNLGIDPSSIITGDDIDFAAFDYVIDAIDTVAAKIDIIERCTECGTPIISAMGCGNRLDPTKLTVTDIHKTEMDPLAKVMRKELRARGIKKLKVVYSKERPVKPIETEDISCNANCICPAGAERKCTDRRSIPGSTSFVPSAAGLIMASEVVRTITGISATID